MFRFGFLMGFPWVSHGLAIGFPWVSHGFAMSFPQLLMAFKLHRRKWRTQSPTPRTCVAPRCHSSSRLSPSPGNRAVARSACSLQMGKHLQLGWKTIVEMICQKSESRVGPISLNRLNHQLFKQPSGSLLRWPSGLCVRLRRDNSAAWDHTGLSRESTAS